MKYFTAGEGRAVMIAAASAFLLTFLVYSRALFCGFVNLDDPIFILNNPFIRNLDSALLTFAFTSRTLDIWMPLTWLSFALDYHFWALNPFGYHLTNVMLHAANSSLVALMSARLLSHSHVSDNSDSSSSTLLSWRLLVPLLAALLFSLHPLRVESVAWVTERKDVLNGFFTLLSLLCYLRFSAKGKGGDYFFSLVFFALSLMSKPVSVVLPLVFLLLDYYPLSGNSTKSFATLLKGKIPFLALSAAAALMTLFMFSQRQMLIGFAKLSLLDRILLSGNATFEYLKMVLFPVGILPFYEMPDIIGGEQLLKTLLISIFFIVALVSARKRPWFFTGALCFLLPLLPVLSFFQNNDVAYAARYTYLPSIAPALIAASGFAAGHDKIRQISVSLRLLPSAFALSLLLLYSAVTPRLIAVWQNTETLWTRVIKLDPSTPKYMDRGVYYIINNRPGDAYRDFSAAIERLAKKGKKPDHNAYAFRGVALMDLEDYENAEKDFDAALALKPHPTYFFYRGLALQALGKSQEAAINFELAGPNPPAIDTF